MKKIDLNAYDFEIEISKFLSKYGFAREQRELSEYDFSIAYRCQNLYIKIRGSQHPFDYPFFIVVVLGDGKSEYPDGEKNSIPLWRIIDAKDNIDSKAYDFDILNHKNGADIIIKDLKKYALEFLRNKKTDDLLKYR